MTERNQSDETNPWQQPQQQQQQLQQQPPLSQESHQHTQHQQQQPPQHPPSLISMQNASRQQLKEELVQLLATRSARRGQFTLASGAQSTLYIDARMTAMSPEGLALIGPLGFQAVKETWNPDSVGGLTLGADPVSYAIAYASMLAGDPLRAFTVRKEPKGHGTSKLIEGPFQPGDRVAVVEDVITTGGSALKAIDAVQKAGATVVGVIALVDREEGGRQAIEATGVPVITLATAKEITARM